MPEKAAAPEDRQVSQPVGRSDKQTKASQRATEHHGERGSAAYLDLPLLQLGLSESRQSRPETQTQ